MGPRGEAFARCTGRKHRKARETYERGAPRRRGVQAQAEREQASRQAGPRRGVPRFKPRSRPSARPVWSGPRQGRLAQATTVKSRAAPSLAARRASELINVKRRQNYILTAEVKLTHEGLAASASSAERGAGLVAHGVRSTGNINAH